jgi:hypothetical protein
VRGGRLRAWMANVSLTTLRCAGINSRLANDMEAVFVLVTLWRFAQLSANQPQPDSRDEKYCCYDHAVNLSKICTIFTRFIGFSAIYNRSGSFFITLTLGGS